MDAVFTTFALASDADWVALASSFAALEQSLAPHKPGYIGASLVRTDAGKAVVFVLFQDRAALDAISRDIAGPWFAAHVRPTLAGPVERMTGTVVASSLGQ